MIVTAIGETNQICFSKYIGSLLPGQQALGLIDNDEAVGAAVFSASENTLTMDHIFIDEEHRKKGLLMRISLFSP